jgi:TonB family protein
VNNGDPVVPATLPPPFLDIARGCLRRDPLMRWKVADIRSRLDPSPVHRELQREPVRPSAAPKGRYLAFGGAIALLLVVIAAWPRSHKSPSQDTQIVPAAPETSNAPVQPKPRADVRREVSQPPPARPQNPPTHFAQAPVISAAKSSAPGAAGSPKAQQPVAAATLSRPAPVSAPVAEAKRETRAGAAQVVVIHQVLPDVPQKARETIRGKVRVSVKVAVDSAGSVSSATLEDSGPSRYFANLALRAAEQWKFSPSNSQGGSSDWILRFVFSADDTQVFPTIKSR